MACTPTTNPTETRETHPYPPIFTEHGGGAYPTPTAQRLKVTGALYPYAMAPDDREPTRADYRNSIETMADVIASRTDCGDVSEDIHQQVDSSPWIIYSNRHLKVLEYAENDPDEWKHLVGDGDSWQQVIQAMAYGAMRADLYDELREREGVDL